MPLEHPPPDDRGFGRDGGRGGGERDEGEGANSEMSAANTTNHPSMQVRTCCSLKCPAGESIHASGAIWAMCFSINRKSGQKDVTNPSTVVCHVATREGQGRSVEFAH